MKPGTERSITNRINHLKHVHIQPSQVGACNPAKKTESGGLWKPVEDCGGQWRPGEACESLWKTVETCGRLRKPVEGGGGLWGAVGGGTCGDTRFILSCWE